MRRLKAAAMSIFGCCAIMVCAQTEDPLGQIHATVSPEGAALTCNGKSTSTPPTTLANLPAGEYLLVATKAGHEEARRTVHLEEGQRINVDLELKPLTGLLIVHTDPPGATVEIDGAYYGETPLLLTDLPLGAYRMKLTSQGYRDREVPLDIEDRTPRKLLVSLDSDAAAIAVDSEPPGARLMVNGITKGTTPCRVERIPEGDVTIELSLDGYKPYTQSVKLVAGQTEAIRAVLEALPAQLTVISRPAGARIYVNNEYRGQAPVTLEKLEPGDYRLRAERDGHDMMARTVQLGLGQRLTEEFRLSGNTGSLQISTEPAGIMVHVDGREIGATTAKAGETDKVSEPFVVEELTEGTHQVQLSRKGFESEEFFVKVERDTTASFHKRLVKLFIPDCELITKNAVHKGVLVEVAPNGTVKLETHPGVVRTFPPDEIRFRRPLREEH